jgi:alkanesulfonate monooxygenase SsuD/methylene tetrahydromethanopterin reductase-like flavin-dependent oxidoreductase (luciferase family)
MTGPATLTEHTTPTITKAAAEAGRPAPRISASLPVRVTADVDAARGQAAQIFQIYGMLPSYRAMLDREGAAGPEDVAIIGDEATVRAAVQRVADSGATDFVAVEFGGSPSERAETRELLRSLI